MKSFQTTLKKQVIALCRVIEKMGNPFMNNSGDLLLLDTRDIATADVVNTNQENKSSRRGAVCELLRQQTEQANCIALSANL